MQRLQWLRATRENIQIKCYDSLRCFKIVLYLAVSFSFLDLQIQFYTKWIHSERYVLLVSLTAYNLFKKTLLKISELPLRGEIRILVISVAYRFSYFSFRKPVVVKGFYMSREALPKPRNHANMVNHPCAIR